MKSIKSIKDYRTSSTMKCNSAIMKTWYKLWLQTQNQICAKIHNNDNIPNRHHRAHSHQTHARISPHRTNLTIALTLLWISILAWNSPNSMRAVSIWPNTQAHSRAVYPFYQHIITTHQTTIHTIHCHALHHHRTATSTTANISDPNRHISATNKG